jgi:hypothetical protein
MSGTSNRTEQVTLRIPRDLLAELRKAAAKQRTSLAAVILARLGAKHPTMGRPAADKDDKQ